MRERKFHRGMKQDSVSEDSFAWTSFDRAMTEAIFRQHAPFVAGLLVRLGVASRHIDEDVLRVFSELHRRAASAPAGASTKAWVAAVALRTAVQRYQPLLMERSRTAEERASDPSVDEFL